MSYGFSPDVMPKQVPNPKVSRGSHDSTFDTSTSSHPIGWALSRGDSVHSSVSEEELVKYEDEIPCQAIVVPADQMPIYAMYDSVSMPFQSKKIYVASYSTLQAFSLF